MLFGGLIGGWLYRWRPRLAQHPVTGFFLTVGASLLRGGLISIFAFNSPEARLRIEEFGSNPGHRQSFQHRSVKLRIQLAQCSDNLRRHLGIAADQLKVSSNLDNRTVIGKVVRKLRHWCVMGEY
jgi:hypothetical protein